MSQTEAIKIDLDAVLAAKLGGKARFIPGFIRRGLKKLIHQDDLNYLLEHNFPQRGPDFCRGILDDLDVRLNVRRQEAMPADRRVIVVSNHPLGGLDGITMIAWLSSLYGNCPVHFVVNDLLMAIEPLRDCFVPVNTHGSQSRGSAGSLDAALAGDDPVVIYPAGLVSRLGDDGAIRDLTWRKMVINKAIESRRDIVPVHFDGRNSASFYRWARRRKRSGLKFNFEMILLPREVFRCKGSTFTLTCGDPISWQSLRGGPEAAAQIAEIKDIVYSLPEKYNR